MLVYANHLAFQGEGAKEAIFKAIGGWLKEQMGRGLHPNQLRQDGEYRGERDGVPTWLKIHVTDEEKPQLYAWTLRVTDSRVHGRRWITELGLRISGDDFEVSCILKTDETSVLVTDPILPSRPRFVRYVVENVRKVETAGFSPGMAGVSVKHLGAGEDAARALLADIEHRERDYPLVLVSPDHKGEYLVRPEHLQEDLVGLAQVVTIDPETDTFAMSEILGKRWSAWGGAVNLIGTPSRSGRIRNRLFLAVEIEGWGETQHARISQLLAQVTASTNVPRARKAINAEGIRHLALRRRLERSRNRVESLDIQGLREELESVWRDAIEQSKEIERLRHELDNAMDGQLELEIAKGEVEDQLRKKEYELSALKQRFASEVPRGGQLVNMDLLVEMSAGLADDPSPEQCLEIISSVYPDRCAVLQSAFRSAEKSRQFSQGRRLLRLLVLLVTKYRDILLSGGGDSRARQVFGKNEFAAKESERVMSNPEFRKARTFEYEGKPVEMFRHLKIGVDDDLTKTIRVHFHWDAKKQKIVIGYCGPHLPVISH